MHDPMTVAFENKYITVWHVDPETDGSDDSCGWSRCRLTEEQRKWAEEYSKKEWEFWFHFKYDCINFLYAEDLAILGEIWALVREQVDGINPHKDLRHWDIAQIFKLLMCPGDNFHHIISSAKKDRYEFERLLALTMGIYKTRKRRWWQHPRWHIHHWKLQIKPLQKYLRWQFSRCAWCGRRFRWGYNPVTSQWDSDGPKWFKSEKNMYHLECFPKPTSAQEVKNA